MKIAHISDLHFGMNLPVVINAFCEDIKQVAPDIILISGDVTHRAKAAQFKLFKQFLQKLPGKILVVPGNHDMPLHNIIMRWIKPFYRYDRYIKKYYGATWQSSKLNILGINSAIPYYFKGGHLSDDKFALIDKFFKEKNAELNILFFHHNIDDIYRLHHPLHNNQAFLDYLKQSNIDIVCTGHLHHAHISLIEKDDHHSCVVLHAGSLCCTRTRDHLNSYYVLNQDGLNCTIEQRAFSDNHFVAQALSNINLAEQYAAIHEVMFAKPT
ncbi:MAG: 3',5'-cyclic-nucleotide phosphodiesterase [Legionellaceae bacterium]|nr:3',5'-cyclic-nucleotide phosphodiesterase [Legionellaceae bacterium]HCA89604.1 3',5'-cyclic-nucleotide phosphodiesterase [Legionellales bacterium]|tara:strand:+ start:1323 stop:2129 length:807 start_codon:yes stop_codon:yes gene_type:complete